MRNLYLLNVTVHVLAALLWLGGMFFFALVGAPVLRRLEPAALRARIFAELGQAFRAVGWIAIAVLLATGALNLYFAGILRGGAMQDAAFSFTPYGRALAWKLAAVAVMIAVSAVHDFVLGPRAGRLDPGSPAALRARSRAAWLARINALVGLGLVYAAVRLARGG
jgi:putative copper resistance protein D